MSRDDEIGDRGQDDGEHVAERLDAYRTGELESEARRRVEAHLEACARCREELAALGAWTAAVERGYEARRAQAAALAPDWAAQRSAIVDRTSGRRAAEGRWAFGRWAPQIALVALAALIVGIVWRENPRERDVLSRAPTRSAEEAAAGAGPDPAAAPDADPAAEAARGPAAEPAGPPGIPPAATPERARRQARPAEAEQQAAPAAVERRAENQEAFADRGDEASLAAPLPEVERFERQARAALLARDTAAARRALALWRDTLAADGDSLVGGADMLEAAPAAAPLLADSLRELLERAE